MLRISLERSAAYLAGWLQVLRSDSRLVIHAAASAQKAADLILGRSEADVVEGADSAAAA